MELYRDISEWLVFDILERVDQIVARSSSETRLSMPGSINIFAGPIDFQFRKSSPGKNIIAEPDEDIPLINYAYNSHSFRNNNECSSQKRSPRVFDSDDKQTKKVMTTPNPDSKKHSGSFICLSDEEKSIKKITKKIEEYDAKLKKQEIISKSDRKSSICNISSQLDSIVEDLQE